MTPDTNREEEGTEPVPERRSLRPEEWIRTPRFVAGVALAVLGVLLAGFELLAPGGMLPNPSAGQVLLVGVVVIVLGAVVALSGYRLTARQRGHLDQADLEALEIEDYLTLLEDAALEEPESTWEIRSRLERARTKLERAREAAYRRDYANFLSLYYEASRQEILLYGLLDHRAEGWTFGLGIDARSEGEGSGSARLLNLGRRIRSYAEESLPEQRQRLVREYLGESDDRPPTPLNLYYAVRVLHEWNVSRYERAVQVRRFLQGGILVLVVVLVGLAAILGLGFVGSGGGADGFLETVNATGTGATSVPADSVLLDDAFLGLVVLTGALGALFSMVYRSFGEFYSLTTDPSVPEPVFMMEALLARTLFGGVSALFLFLVARTEFAGAVFAAGFLTNPLALLVVSFVAGFSEQLVDETVDRIAEDVGAPRETDGSDESGGTDEVDRTDEVDGPNGPDETDGTDGTGGTERRDG
jgi:hypothetical protein